MFTQKNIQECYYITHLDNLAFVFNHGILSRKRRERIGGFRAVSNTCIQDRRMGKVLERARHEKHDRPRGLHRHANLYINPCNAMMLDLVDSAAAKKAGIDAVPREDLCVLRISRNILNRGDVVISDKNASTDAAKFFITTSFYLPEEERVILFHPEPVGFKNLVRNFPSFFSTIQNRNLSDLNKKIHQAEVLVPYKVQPDYIVGIFVYSEVVKAAVNEHIVELNLGRPIDVTANEKLFLQSTGNGGQDRYEGWNFDGVAPVPLADEYNEALNNISEPDSSDSEDEGPVINLQRNIVS